MHPAMWLALGLVALVLGAELVVRYGSRLARRLGVPPMIVGLTVVSLGTSTPELAVGIDAMRQDAGSLAIGNIAGTNVVNLLLIFGLSAAIRAIVVDERMLRLDLPAMLVASGLVYALSLDGELQPWDGVPLLACAVVYSTLLWRWTRGEHDPLSAEYEREFAVKGEARRLVWRSALLLAAGLVVIVVGADWLVDGAESLARQFGVSDALIGLTIVAIGTSTPELATTVISTIRGDRDIAIGNLIGSSVYNLTFILGIPVLAAGGSGPIADELIAVDLLIMVAVALICVPLFFTGRRFSRTEGVLFVVAYAAYLAYLITART